MALVDVRDLLAHARRHRYAVGAFDPVSLDCLESVIAAAEAAHAPLILSLPGPCDGQRGFGPAMAAVHAAARRATVPVALLADRCASFEAAVQAINHGCNAVTVDTAGLPAGGEIAATRALVDMAHACGIAVEGACPGPASAGLAQAFVEQTGIDMLAVEAEAADAVRAGAAPGLVPLTLRLDRMPSAGRCRRMIDSGVSLVHAGAVLAQAASARLGAASGGTGSYGAVIEGMRSTIRTETETLIRLFGAAGRAAEVLQQARAWQTVEHLIVYNVQDIDATQAEAMMRAGRETLAHIPGVRRVASGRAIADGARYRFCWIIEFTDPAVIASYRDHPAHVAFADRLFRPVAGDRISIDYLLTE